MMPDGVIIINESRLLRPSGSRNRRRYSQSPKRKFLGIAFFTQTEDNKGIERRGEMTIMKFEIIEDYITQFPIYQYALLDTRELEFTDKVRTICKKECSRYGSSWSCPPAVGSIEKCRETCLKYPKVLLFSSIAEVVDYSDMECTLKSKQEHENITRKIEKFLRLNAVSCYTLSTDSCSACEKCSYPKKSCVHPEIMHPCIESHGIVLTNTIEQHHMDYFLGENMVIWFSLIFLEDV